MSSNIHRTTGRSRRRGWIRSLSWLALVAGVLVSLGAAFAWRQSVERRNRDAFAATVSNVQNVVSTQIARQDDLLATLSGMVSADPAMSNRFFFDWYTRAHVPERFPGTIGISYEQRVPAADLAAFSARQEADPVTGLPSDGTFTVFPDTPSSVYCLQRLGVWETNPVEDVTVPAGLDYCATELPALGPSPIPAVLEEATVTGAMSIVPNSNLSPNMLVEFAPVYSTGTLPATVEDRRALVVGWVGASFDVRTLADPAVAGSPNTQVEVFHSTSGDPTSVATAGGLGSAPVSSTTMPASDNGMWTVTVSSVVGAGSMGADTQGLLVLLGGVFMTALLFVLIRVQLDSSDRALTLVREKTEELKFRAMHDTLTGLPNRALILDRATQMLTRQSRAGTNVSALFIDLDNFKTINDTLGHAVGDEVLRAVARRVGDVLRESDTVGRLGGDEFVVLLENPSEVGGSELVAQRIINALDPPVLFGEVPANAACSIGIASGLHESAEDLFHHADLAMYQAKLRGRGGFVVFEPSMEDAIQERARLERDLGEALENGELFLLYQPTFDLRTHTTTGAEALIRWNHPTRGEVAPADFIPIAEESNLIVPIGRWVLQTACAQCAEWRADGFPVQMSVNVSGRQLDRDGFVDEVRFALEQNDLRPDYLTLEIAETTLMRDADTAKRRLIELKALGVHIAIDDFGTGYSSMAFLQQFPVDAIKIDRTFIAGIADTTESHAMIRTLIQLGKTLHLETLAEGIEDHSQLDELLRQDCDAGSGFLYARPMTDDALRNFLVQHEKQQPAAETST